MNKSWKKYLLTLSFVLSTGFCVTGCFTLEADSRENITQEILLSGEEKVLQLDPGSSVILWRADDAKVKLIVAYIEGDFVVTLLENSELSMSIMVNEEGNKSIMHHFRDPEGQEGTVFDSTGDGFPEKRVFFATDNLAGKTEFIHYEKRKKESNE